MTAHVKPSADAGRRTKELAAIHAMKRELALSEECYRARVSQASGGRTGSAGDLTQRERTALIDGLKGLGAGQKRPGGGRSRPVRATGTPIQGKVRALWIEVHKAGGTEDGSEAALGSWLGRQFGVQALQWLDNATAARAIEQLKGWLKRIQTEKEGI
ncbi:regulatory protein GemA [Roseomonas genomospecies 6]|uniref:Regulatory protein GemA n=1 Tax=Roseomonas genomospecies 6 TaxID=214106 RepID=A0A9W7KR19_9PROT|nr:regulatory protein GemA [Roseomonas genomospecies 6]KAA0678095.1 regulatory protein GemA [Roseomonas genomospecies 6]